MLFKKLLRITYEINLSIILNKLNGRNFNSISNTQKKIENEEKMSVKLLIWGKKTDLF